MSKLFKAAMNLVWYNVKTEQIVTGPCLTNDLNVTFLEVEQGQYISARHFNNADWELIGDLDSSLSEDSVKQALKLKSYMR